MMGEWGDPAHWGEWVATHRARAINSAKQRGTEMLIRSIRVELSANYKLVTSR